MSLDSSYTQNTLMTAVKSLILYFSSITHFKLECKSKLLLATDGLPYFNVYSSYACCEVAKLVIIKRPFSLSFIAASISLYEPAVIFQT